MVLILRNEICSLRPAEIFLTSKFCEMRFVRCVISYGFRDISYSGFPRSRFCEMSFVRCVSVDLQPVSSMYQFDISTTPRRIICQNNVLLFPHRRRDVNAYHALGTKRALQDIMSDNMLSSSVNIDH